MPGTFQSFPFLPEELRVRIWKLNIRPAISGAHRFRFAENADEAQDMEASSGLENPHHSRLCAPRCLPKPPHEGPPFPAQADMNPSWTQNNPSTYLIDTALWTACKESQRVLAKEFLKRSGRGCEKTWKRLHTKLQKNDMKDNEFAQLVPGSLTFRIATTNQPQYITVFPENDLFIVEADDLHKLQRTLLCSNIVHASSHVHTLHIAIEVHGPPWSTAGSQIIPELCKTFFPEAEFKCHLWLIDHSLKRTGNVLPADKKKSLRVFLDNRDRRFVEVPFGPGRLPPANECEWDFPEHGNGIFRDWWAWVHWLGSMARLQWSVSSLHSSNNDGFGDSDSESRGDFELGVLACEYL